MVSVCQELIRKRDPGGTMTRDLSHQTPVSTGWENKQNSRQFRTNTTHQRLSWNLLSFFLSFLLSFFFCSNFSFFFYLITSKSSFQSHTFERQVRSPEDAGQLHTNSYCVLFLLSFFSRLQVKFIFGKIFSLWWIAFHLKHKMLKRRLR